jgi:hypothetical protein
MRQLRPSEARHGTPISGMSAMVESGHSFCYRSGRRSWMKLNAIQWAWMGAAALFVASLLLDVINIVNVPPVYMLLCSTSLLVAGWWVGPSLIELEKAQRRRS